MEIVNPQDAAAGLADIRAGMVVDWNARLYRIKMTWLQACGSCDGGLPMTCTCPVEDYRPVMAELVDALEKFRERASLLSASTMGEAFDRLEELVEKEKELARTRAELNEVYELAQKADRDGFGNVLTRDLYEVVTPPKGDASPATTAEPAAGPWAGLPERICPTCSHERSWHTNGNGESTAGCDKSDCLCPVSQDAIDETVPLPAAS